MDAARLVAEGERVMRGDPQPEHVIAEAWQAYELTEALAQLLAPDGGPLGAWADGTGEGDDAAGKGTDGHREGGGATSGWTGGTRARAGGAPGRAGTAAAWGAGTADHGPPVLRAGPAPRVTAVGPGPPRAARLTGARDPAGTLRALHVLLSEIGTALVALTCTAEDEAAYSQCIEALDAVDEAKDQVRALARDHPS